jgi:hypothetical protein
MIVTVRCQGVVGVPRSHLILVMSIVSAGCSPGLVTPEIVFINVSVLSMTSETIMRDYAVVVKNGVIKASTDSKI